MLKIDDATLDLLNELLYMDAFSSKKDTMERDKNNLTNLFISRSYESS